MEQAIERTNDFKTMQLYWNLKTNTHIKKEALYLKLNKEKVDAAVYIFKLRSGNDGSTKTLKTRHLLEDNESTECVTCWEEETPQHILEECVRY